MKKEIKKILLVEDNEGDILLFKEALAEVTFSVTIDVCNDGEEALDYFSNQKGCPSMVILDINLPRLNGFEVLEALKSSTNYRKTPVIILTTSSSIEDLNKAYDLHANSFITKPFNSYDFVKMIESLKNFWYKTASLPKS